MEEFSTLLTDMTLEQLILTIITIAIAVRYLGGLFDWFREKMRRFFDIENKKERKESELRESIESLKEKQQSLFTKFEAVTAIEEKIDLITERLQNSSRSYIIEKHHWFCYHLKYIDTYSLDAIEREYMHYKQDGGDSFIDALMDEIRSLPRTPNEIENIM